MLAGTRHHVDCGDDAIALGGWRSSVATPPRRPLVGVVWLGAAAARIGSLVFDKPRTDTAFWAYLPAEISLGAAALLGARRLRTGNEGS
jgi:hypothetical protein